MQDPERQERNGSAVKAAMSLSRGAPRDHGPWPRPAVWSGEPQLLIHRRRNNPDHPTDISDRYRTSETGRAKKPILNAGPWCRILQPPYVANSAADWRLLVGTRKRCDRFTGLFFCHLRNSYLFSPLLCSRKLKRTSLPRLPRT